MKIHCLHVGLLDVCCYLVWDEATRNCAVIDPGGDAPRIRAALATHDLTLRHIFLTHLHYDHIGAVDALRDTGAEVWVCPAELSNGTLSMSHGLMDLTLPLSHYDEGAEIILDGLRFTVLRTPGHTPGSVCLRCGDVLFTGDTLFAGTCGRRDFEGGSGTALRHSLRRLGLLEGDYTVLSGHSEPTTLARERATNPYLREAMA